MTQFLNRFKLRAIDQVKLSDAAMVGNTFIFFAFHPKSNTTFIIIICTVGKKQFLEKTGMQSAASFEYGSKSLRLGFWSRMDIWL